MSPLIRAAPLLLARSALGIAALGWGVSVLAVLVGPATAHGFLEMLGGRSLPTDPLYAYWLTMAGLGFGLIGVGFGQAALTCGRRPRRAMALLLFQLLAGLVLLRSGESLGLDSNLHRWDAAFCLSTGLVGMAGLWLERHRVRRAVQDPAVP